LESGVDVMCVVVFRCNVVIHFFDNAVKVAVKEETCDECGASEVEVEFKVSDLPYFSFSFIRHINPIVSVVRLETHCVSVIWEVNVNVRVI